MVSKREQFDLVVFGATSFVGQILCEHLVSRHGTDGAFRWAIAGRNPEKLERVAGETGADVDRIEADAMSPDDMRRLAESARVIVSTVGPYALYGSELVAAVAAAGTDYCDLAGEPHWIRRMIDAHSSAAESSGARIIHSCGVDSIPSDLGVLFTQQEAASRHGVPCDRIRMRVKAFRGAFSGGTVASMKNVVKELSDDPGLREVLGNPYALAPEGARRGVRQPNVTVPRHEEGSWLAPFMMGAVNTKVVHRTHALLGRPWGDDFRYDEASMMGAGLVGAGRALAMSAGIGAFVGAAAIGPVRTLLDKVLPEPGSGPSPEARENGSFDFRFFGSTPDGHSLTTKVTGDRDPGYGSSAKMLGEAAFALSRLGRERVGGGFWTPATAFGEALIGPLEEHAGLAFGVIGEG